MRAKLSRNRVGRLVAGVWAGFAAAVVVAVAADAATGQPPVYQRNSSAAYGPYRGGNHHGKGVQHAAPQVSAGWFQRPYPYHLDYYRMRYGGSYAPYFGNLYGPPNVVLAAPYYGGYGYGGNAPYAGGYGYPPPGYANGGAPNGAVAPPPAVYPNGTTAGAGATSTTNP